MPHRGVGFGGRTTAARTVLLTFLIVSSTFAQSRHPVHFKRDGLVASETVRVARTFPDTLRVLALMVDFQTDTDSRTTGNGKFLLQPPTQNLIDPPPHDSSYFASKLHFLENYFRKSSNGQLIVQGDVVGSVVTLSKPMAAYSPPSGGGEDSRLADLVIESWRKADSLHPELDFSRYEAFILFHAGVGRDIDLVSILGFDPTPNDIPSLYIGLQSLRTMLNNPAYPGIPVRGGSFHITNTMIVPETQSRDLTSGGSTATLQLSINGLLASSLGSFLGLPDLFDTKTGRSAIGRFGLMDVASIFAFNGLFPPEPSAWEKARLGWLTPITINGGAQTISLPAVGHTAVGRDTVYKIPISAGEYFLVENRNRDPQSNGQRLTFIRNGVPVTVHYTRDTTGFRYNDVQGAWGSLIDVEDFDWALLGLMGEEDRTIEGGGILIWHIDERVIDAAMAANEVNANPKRRGVALKEADGADDIGQEYGLFDAGFGSELGSPYDCWFATNPSPVYKNVFDATSFPNSNSNAGARSLVRISNFSPRGPRMSAVVQIGDALTQPLPAFSRTFSRSTISHPTTSQSGVYFGAGDSVFALAANGSSKTTDPTGLLSIRGGRLGVAVLDLDAQRSIIAGVSGNSLFLIKAEDQSSDGVFDLVQTVTVQLGRNATTAPAFLHQGQRYSVMVGGEQGTLWIVDLDGTIERQIQAAQTSIVSMTQLPLTTSSNQSTFFFSTSNRLFTDGTSTVIGGEQTPWLISAGTSSPEDFVVAARRGSGDVTAFNASLDRQLFFTSLPDAVISSIAVGDIDRDGRKDIILLAGQRLYVLNQAGVSLDGFPVRLSQADSFVGAPVVVDVDGDGRFEVLTLTDRGLLIGFESNGRVKEGFPIQATAGGGASLAAFRTSGDRLGLVVTSESGEVRAMELNSSYAASRVVWSQHLRDALHTNRDPSTTPSPVQRYSTFLPRESVYNWPNPVYESSTNIRFYLESNASVTVKIFDLAGSKVTEFRVQGIGGIDNEVTWEVGDVQSGVYLAHVEAVGNGRSETAVIKIAVVK
jgi:hypothetical protein